MSVLVLYALLTTSAYYLGARAVLTRPLWSRYPGWLDALMGCAACAGAWYGAAGALALGLALGGHVGVRADRDLLVEGGSGGVRHALIMPEVAHVCQAFR